MNARFLLCLTRVAAGILSASLGTAATRGGGALGGYRSFGWLTGAPEGEKAGRRSQLYRDALNRAFP